MCFPLPAHSSRRIALRLFDLRNQSPETTRPHRKRRRQRFSMQLVMHEMPKAGWRHPWQDSAADTAACWRHPLANPCSRPSASAGLPGQLTHIILGRRGRLTRGQTNPSSRTNLLSFGGLEASNVDRPRQIHASTCLVAGVMSPGCVHMANRVHAWRISGSERRGWRWTGQGIAACKRPFWRIRARVGVDSAPLSRGPHTCGGGGGNLGKHVAPDLLRCLLASCGLPFLIRGNIHQQVVYAGAGGLQCCDWSKAVDFSLLLLLPREPACLLKCETHFPSQVSSFGGLWTPTRHERWE